MMTFRVRYRRLGDHVHCRVFCAPRAGTTFAKMGDLTVAEVEFEALRIAMRGFEFLEEER